MALETGTYVSDLVATNPVGSTDKVKTLDDHDRLIKDVLLNSLPDHNHPEGSIDIAGVADVYTATFVKNAPTAYVKYMRMTGVIGAGITNTGAATLNVNALGAKVIVRPGGAALQAGDVTAGEVVFLVYDGTSFVVLSQRAVGIADNNLLEVDGAPNSAEYARFTASGLEGRTEAEFKADFNLEIGTDVQAQDAELAALAGLTSAADKVPYFTGSGTAALAAFTAAGRALVDDANAAAQRTTLGVAIGSDVQAYDVELAALAGLTSTANRLPYFTGSGTAALATFTAAGRALVDDSSASAQRVTLGVAIGSDVQAYSAVLDGTTASYTTAEETKLAGIEASADVTDVTNVTAAGALMDSEVDADIKTLALPANTTISAFGKTLVDDAAASNARTTLGLGLLAILNTINNGNWSGADLAVSNGGTGSSTAATARAALGVAYEVISSGSVSAAASLDFTGLTATYRAYKLVFDDLLSVTDNVAFVLRTDTNNGASFEAGASDYAHTRIAFAATGSVTGSGSNAAAQIQLTTGMGNVAATEKASGEIDIYNPMDSGGETQVIWKISRVNSTGNMQVDTGSGRRIASEANNAFQVLLSSGNISTMNYTLYGLRAS